MGRRGGIEIMRWKEALDYIQEKAESTADSYIRNTFSDIYGVLLRASTFDGNRWAAKIEKVAAYVEAGNYACSHKS